MKTRVEQLRDEGRFRVPLDQQYPELARREQAAGVAGCHSCGFSFRVTNATSLEKGECAKCGADWPLHGKREQAQAPQPEMLLTAIGAQIARSNEEYGSHMADLRAELARLRSLLAECVDIIDVLMMDDGILSEPQYAAIEAAKEAVK